MADPIKLQQLLLNLAINARDAMNRVGELSIRTFSHSASAMHCASCHEGFSGEYIAIVVSDSGEGVAEENLERIFDPFFSTKEIGAGTGMGLSVVHGIAHDLGGHILVKSQLGEGSDFTVLLPVIEYEAGMLVNTRSGEGAAVGNIRVMLVDNEASLLALMREQLDALGFGVVGYTHPKDALIAFKNNPDIADILVTDYMMPQCNGLELAAEILDLKPALPIIMCGESDSPEDISRAQAIGVMGYLHKPVEIEVLANKIQELLTGRTP